MMRNPMVRVLPAALAGLVLAGCGGEAEQSEPQPRNVRRVTAWIEPKSDTDTYGSAIFINEGERVDLQVRLETSPSGTHQVAIHENGDCSAADAASAGPPWGSDELHRVGEIKVGEDGTGELSFSTERWSMGSTEEHDVLGKAVVIHSKETRIGCGVIPEN